MIRRINQLLLLLALTLAAHPLSARADLIPPIESNRISQRQPSTTLNGTFDWLQGRVSSVIFLLLGGMAVIYLIWSGIQYITAAGNAEQTKKARESIIHIVLGIILLVSTYYILRILIGIPSLFVPGSS